MGRPRQKVFRVKLVESAGDDQEAVRRALRTWAILLADHAQRAVVQELREPPNETGVHRSVGLDYEETAQESLLP